MELIACGIISSQSEDYRINHDSSAKKVYSKKNGSTLKWVLVGTNKFFYFFIETGYSFGFGNIKTFFTDPFSTFIAGQTSRTVVVF